SRTGSGCSAFCAAPARTRRPSCSRYWIRNRLGPHMSIRSCALGAAILGLLALSSGCGDSGNDPRRPGDVSAEVSDSISTVVHVSWRTQEPTRGYVEYGKTRELGLQTPMEGEPTQQHSVALLGLGEDTEYCYRVVTWDGDNAGASDLETVRTGYLPGGMPSLDLQGEGHDQYTLVPVLGNTTAITIISPEGEIVWYHRD